MNAFYYDHVEDRGLVKKTLSGHVEQYFEEQILPEFKQISYEEYWRKHAMWMMSAVRACYFIHDDAAYWGLELDPFTVIRFKDKEIYEAEVPTTDYDDEGPDPQYELIFDSWDDIMERLTDSWDECTDDEISTIALAIDWTGEMHREMNEKLPRFGNQG